MSHLVLRNVEVEGQIVGLTVVDGRIHTIAPHVDPGDGLEIDGRGGALIPGLHDHHMHLYAAAAAAASVDVGPPVATDLTAFARALTDAERALPPGRWLRAVGYHASVSGDLDRAALDRLVSHRPVRVQDRTGVRWTLNSAAIEAIDLGRHEHPGIERDPAGQPTGRLHRADRWLRSLLPAEATPDLAALGARLASYGVTGVTDTTPFDHPTDLNGLAAAVASRALPQRVVITGGPELIGHVAPAGLEQGPVKLVIDDGLYPSLDELAAHIDRSHQHGRTVAIHCVTRTSLVLALAAWDAAGSRSGDRVEHGSVVPPELIEPLRRHELTVVTQPGFIGERGDEYLRDVDADDLPHLYPYRRLLEAGIRVAGSTDAPYSALDPWQAMRAAVSRRTPRGAVLGVEEAVTPEVALGLFLGDPHDPSRQRRLEPGMAADLCVLSLPLSAVLARLSSDDVATTIRGGAVLYRRPA